jgi:hypothetical protein
MAKALVLAALICACSSDNPQPSPPTRAEPETAVGSLSPNESPESLPVAGEGHCPAGTCPSIMLFGSLAPGCCRGVDACGGSVKIAENSWLCVPPDYDQTAETLRTTLEARADEPFVPEPGCPSQTFDGATLAGCCIAASTCGVSTELWTAAAAEFGLRLPTTCILASEAAELAGAAVADGGTPPPCASAGGNSAPKRR